MQAHAVVDAPLGGVGSQPMKHEKVKNPPKRQRKKLPFNRRG